MVGTGLLSARAAVVREGWTLRERLRAAPAGEPAPGALDHPALADWRTAVAPQRASDFERRLERSGATLAHAAWAVDPPRDAPPADPPWLPVLARLQEACRAGPSAAVPGGAAARPFEELWWPVCNWGRDQLCGELDPAVISRVSPEALASLSRALLDRLGDLTEDALYERLYRRRGAGPSLLARLKGDPTQDGAAPRDLYLAFVEEHRADGLSSLLSEYPVLGRLLATTVSGWLAGARELLERAHLNRGALARVFDIAEDACLRDIEPDLSDPHRGGRTVAKLHFESSRGERCTVVYKPRPMSVDRAYQILLERLNSLPGGPSLRAARVLPVDDYGFMELAEWRPCADERELERFYRNAGRLLAVLWVLGCDDCHHENLVATGDQLVLIDVETLFQGTLAAAKPGDPAELLARSVLRVGLLPSWRFVSMDGRMLAMDASGLGVRPPERRTARQHGWVATNTDRMHRGPVEVPVKPSSACPVDVGAPHPLSRFRHEVGQGFAAQLRHLLSHRDELLAPGGVLDIFAGLPRRVVVRPTQIYAGLQRQALEPAVLRSAAARGTKLDQLSRRYLTADEQPGDWALFESELEQLENLDVPYFSQLVDGRELSPPGGAGAISGYVRATGLEASRELLASLDQADVDFQLQLVRGAIEASSAGSAGDRSRQGGHSSTAAPDRGGIDAPLDRDGGLDEAVRLAAQVRERMLRDRDGRPYWLGLDLADDEQRFRFGIVGLSLYSGRGGIGVFFAELARRLAGRPEHDALAAELRDDVSALVESVTHPLREDDSFALFRWLRDQPLGLAGVAGVFLALLNLGRADLVAALATGLTAALIEGDDRADVLGGAAGLIGPLVAIAEADRARDEALALATVCGDRVVALQAEDGGWPTAASKKALTGFAHGAGGISAALARLHLATGADRFLAAARRGLEYERAQFSPQHANWPHFLTTAEPTRFMNSWCNGAPGIALARLCLRGTVLWDEEAEREVGTALATTVRDEAPVDQVCCGVFGRAAILRLATLCGQGPEWAAAARRLVGRSVAGAERRAGSYRLFALAEGQLFLPGLFTGTSGIGLVLAAGDDVSGAVASCLSGGLLTRQSGQQSNTQVGQPQ